MLTASSKGCGLSYQRIVDTIIADVAPSIKMPALPSELPCPKRQREADSESDDEPRQFRRVRIRCLRRAEKQGCQDEAKFENLSEPGWETVRCICGTQSNLRLPEYTSHGARPTRMWLIQCVDCKVLQHRSCVGTANGYDPPGGYYCGECRGVKPIDSLVIGNAKECTNERLGGFAASARPDFWACCACMNINSKAICPGRCGICGHNKCTSCSTYNGD